MAKQKMQVTLKNYYNPEQGQYGMSQGSYVITDKGEFKCYNTGPEWFGTRHKGQTIEVMGEWKQNQKTQVWYVACTFGKKSQEPPSPSPQSGPPPASQAAPQARQQPNGSESRLIVAQVVYKALVARAEVNTTKFDVWLTQNIALYKRHIDMIMKAGADTLPETGRSEPQYQENDQYVGDDPAPPPEDEVPF